MSTGLETWNQNIPENIGALYPGAGGIEVPLAIIGIVTWIAWHVIQIRRENASIEEDLNEVLNTPEKMEEALELSEAGTIVQSVGSKSPQLRYFAHDRHNAENGKTGGTKGAAAAGS
jgi:hypothetical protein